ncbi:CAP domain-containing protein [Streptomyces iakyrus]|uniref:CAP domain-containing protein n=1 Tax=Streptomyces iakyrus TaxID=68219 RepID=UPI0036E5A20F
MGSNRVRTIIAIGVIFSLLLVALTVAENKKPDIAQPVSVEAPAHLPKRLDGIELLVNAEREARGNPAFRLNAQLNHSAMAKAEHMVDVGYWDHVAPDGTTAWDFINQAGYQYQHAGENLGKCHETHQALVKAWVDSPTHLANIEDDYTEFGFGYAYRPDGCMIVVNHFGRP